VTHTLLPIVALDDVFDVATFGIILSFAGGWWRTWLPEPVGFLLFTLLKVPPFAGFLAVPAIDAIEPLWIVWAIVLGGLGAALEAYVAVALRIAGRATGGRPHEQEDR